MAMPATSAVTGPVEAGAVVVELLPPSTTKATAAISAAPTTSTTTRRRDVQQVVLDGVQEVVHGVTLAIAGAVGELGAAGVEALVAVEVEGWLARPAGERRGRAGGEALRGGQHVGGRRDVARQLFCTTLGGAWLGRRPARASRSGS